jgi:hypothetical protein
MGYTRLSLGLSAETVSKIDEARGDVPRERWLRRLIEEQLADTWHPMDSPDRSARGDGGWSTKVERQPVSNRAGHEWVGVKDTCMKMGCEYPKDRKAHQ